MSFRTLPVVLKTVTPSPSFASALRRSSINACIFSFISAYSRFVTSYTSCMLDPGRISWNWFNRTTFHILSSSSAGYGSASCVNTDSSSRSISPSSAFLFERLLRAIEVYVPLWYSKYSSPSHTGSLLSSATRSFNSSKNVRANT